MNAWNIDADTIKLNDSWDNLCFITNDKIEEYLREDEKLFIIAAKGLGKTFVLKKKSKMKRDRGEGAIHIPKTELCEKIGGPYQHVIFGHEEFEHLNKINQWRTIWTLCIYIVVLNNIEKPLPENLKVLFEHSNSITSILNIILDHRRRLHEFSREIDTTLRSIITNINQTVFLYIDNVDEAFNNYLNIAKNKPNQNIEGVWVYSQLGLMEAAKETLQCNRHIKVYASIRIEAYNLNKNPTFLQMKSYICFIKYSKEEVEKIFLKNVSAYLGRREEIKPIDLLKDFFGFIKIPHPVVKENNRLIQENIFDYLYRHTFGRPREIVYLGNSLSNPPSSNRTKVDPSVKTRGRAI